MGENNFDMDVNDYVKQAYEHKKWAFVSDVARFWILYRHGGIYLDTDVELLRSPLPLIERGAVFRYGKNWEACGRCTGMRHGGTGKRPFVERDIDLLRYNFFFTKRLAEYDPDGV